MQGLRPFDPATGGSQDKPRTTEEVHPERAARRADLSRRSPAVSRAETDRAQRSRHRHIRRCSPAFRGIGEKCRLGEPGGNL